MRIHSYKKKDITLEMICEAQQGNEKAEDMIFDYFESYIIGLSKVPYINRAGNIQYAIDKDIYMALKLKLHKLILGFEIV